MAIIVDPDNLDRLQVLVDYENQKIGIKPVDSASPIVNMQTATDTGNGTTYYNTSQFQDTAATFATAGVSSGDILTIINGKDVNHWTVTGLVAETGLLVNGTFSSGEAHLNYAVLSPTGGTVTEGATLQAIYSFLKEEWKTKGAGFVDLIQFVFPLESITREQFEIGGAIHGDWDWRDDDTRNLIRTGGWARLDSSGNTKQQYAGIITLGSLDSDTQVYYLQVNSTSGTATQPKNFVLTGPVNQAILIRDTDTSTDLRSFLKLFARKKGKSYAESQISDIGVTTLETIVNRFPVSHADDPAIVATDGELAGGTSVYQEVTEVFNGSDGVTTASDASAQEKTFTFTSSSATFQSYGIKTHDVIVLSGTDSAIDNDWFEIVSVDSDTELTLLQEPGVAIPAESSITYSVNSRIRHPEKTDGSIQSIGGSTLSGTLSSSTANFTGSGVTANDVVAILASGTSTKSDYVGAYKVLSVTDANTLVLNTQDQPFPSTASATTFDYEVYRPGMFLQYKSEHATDVGPLGAGFKFTAGSPDTIQRLDSNSFSDDGYIAGGVVYVGSAEDSANDGSYTISGITTTSSTNDTLQLVSDNSITSNTQDTSAVLSGENGFVRSPQNIGYSFNWRLFGNDGTLSECFQWLQKQLRRGFGTDLSDGNYRGISDIDYASGVFRGDITPLLMSFASPNGTTLNLYIDDLNATEKNNVTFEDILGVGRNFAFISTISISVNQNLLDDADTKIVVFFTNDDAGDNLGRDFGTDQAIIVKDTSGTDMVSLNPSASPVQYEYDYDGNTQRGTASAGTDAPVTIVAIGLDTAQYVSTAGTVTRQSTNVFSLVAALERNYSNP